MDAYEQEIYRFLSQPKNYDNMVKVIDHQDLVYRNVVSDFWDAVLVRLNELNTEYNNKWEILIEEDYFSRWSNLWMKLPAWQDDDEGTPICASWESLHRDAHYGVWINGDSEKWDIKAIKELFEKENYCKEMGGANKHWACKEYIDYDLTNLRDLRHFLPEVRESKVEEYSNLIFDCAETMESLMAKAFKLRKK
jgi:hypothetical protein